MWWLVLVLAITGCASPTGEPVDTSDQGVTYLEALLTFHECAAADAIPEASMQEYYFEGVVGVTDQLDQAAIEACLASSDLDRFESPTGEVTVDDDFIRVTNEYAKAMKACMERKGWTQDDLVFNESGALVPDGSGPTLSDAESQRYVTDSYDCSDEVGDPVEDMLNGEPFVTVPDEEDG